MHLVGNRTSKPPNHETIYMTVREATYFRLITGAGYGRHTLWCGRLPVCYRNAPL